jgi:hypothetical protein
MAVDALQFAHRVTKRYGCTQRAPTSQPYTGPPLLASTPHCSLNTIRSGDKGTHCTEPAHVLLLLLIMHQLAQVLTQVLVYTALLLHQGLRVVCVQGFKGE